MESKSQFMITQRIANPTVFEIVEEVDQIIGEAFQAADTGGVAQDPRLRFELYALLLEGFGAYLPGLNLEKLRYLIESQVENKDRWNVIVTGARRLCVLLPAIARPTYTTMSYWSPIDGQRHTVVHRPVIESEHKQHTLALAYAFYALTLHGEPKGPEDLHSVVHFISQFASHKRGVRVWFREDTPVGPGWWHIPKSIHSSLLRDTGLADAVDRKILKQGGRTNHELEQALNLTLFNLSEKPAEDLDSFATDTLNEFRSRAPGLIAKHRRVVESTRSYLSDLFGNDLTPEQALFMMLTQLIWREACPGTDIMYTFPTLVSDTCCVMTLGTERIIQPETLLALGFIAKSLFVHPLLIDYSTKENASRAFRRMNLFRRLLGHNLPKVLVYPATTQLVRMERTLQSCSEEPTRRVLDRVKNLRVLFEHYDSFLTAVMASGNLRDTFVNSGKRLERFDLGTDVYARAKLAFELLRSHHHNKRLRAQLRLVSDIPKPFPLRGHKAFLTEVLFNLISNAIGAIEPEDVKRDSQRAVLRLTARNQESNTTAKSHATICLADRGHGFTPIKLANYQSIIERIDGATREDFWELVDKLVEDTMLRDAREGHMGIGLLFCAAYLRSLEWQPALMKPGRLQLDSEPRKGTTVTIHYPET